MAQTMKRDYSLASQAEQEAIAAGLAEAEWYRAPIDPNRLAELNQRSNGRAAIHVGLYLALLVGSGVWAYLSLWSWWTIPALFVYGTLYGSSADPRWHECGHGTAFKSTLANNLVYFPASFMLLRDATLWRWSHVRHHSDTIVVARDPEIILARPPSAGDWFPNLFSLKSGPTAMARTVRHALGRISDADRSFIPEREHHKIVREGRIHVALWIALAVWCLVAWSLVPLLFFVGPSFYGAWLMLIFGTTQHLGLREDVLDHRLNTRTVYMNPVLRFLYWNMNYHVEHHMFPTVPTHNLAALHDEIKEHLPEPSPSILAAYRELVPALIRQHDDPTYEIDRPLPGSSAAGSQPSTPTTSVVLRPGAERDGFIDICSVDGLVPGQVRRLDIEDRTFAVYRLGDRYLATDGICTHSRRVHLADGLIIDGQIECPKHNGRFDITSGQPTRHPVCEALTTHDVRVVDGRVTMRCPSGSDRGENK
jgi:fatty acid desaturase/nitrite reductase/ring-hydroxylating ferredoxin subunit